MITIVRSLGALLALAVFASYSHAQKQQRIVSDGLGALAEVGEIPITVDNFVRAATDIEIGKYVALDQLSGTSDSRYGSFPRPV